MLDDEPVRSAFPAAWVRDHAPARPDLAPAGAGPVRAVGYTRYSLKDQKFASEERQKDAIGDYSKAIGATLVAVFSDRGISGRFRSNRPGLQAALDLVKSGGADILVVEDPDRLSRNLHDAIRIWQEMTECGKALHSASCGEIKEGLLIVRCFLPEVHREILERIGRKRRDDAARAGSPVGRRGYGIKGEHNGGICKDPDQVETLLKIVAMLKSGMSAHMVAGVLTAAGGKRWTASKVLRIARSERLKGVLIYGRNRVVYDPATGRRSLEPSDPGDWIVAFRPDLAILAPQQWDELQAIIAPKPRGRNMGRLLTGLCQCASCGRVLKQSGRNPSYICSDDGCQDRLSIPIPELERAVLDQIARMVGELTAPVTKAKTVSPIEAKEAQRRRSAIQAQLEATFMAALKSGATTADMLRRRTELEAQLEALPLADDDQATTRVSSRRGQQLRELKTVTEMLGAVELPFDAVTAAQREFRAAVGRLVGQVAVSKVDGQVRLKFTGPLRDMNQGEP